MFLFSMYFIYIFVVLYVYIYIYIFLFLFLWYYKNIFQTYIINSLNSYKVYSNLNINLFI